MSLKKRNEVDKSLTWDLTLIYKDKASYEQDICRLKELTETLKAYRGCLNEAETINKALDDYREFLLIAGKLGNYTSLALSADYTDSAIQEEDGRLSVILASAESDISFLEGEIGNADAEILKVAASLNASNQHYIEDILRNKPHRLSDESEKLLAALGPLDNSPYTVYETVKLADMTFPGFEVNGKEYPLSYSLFEDDYEYESDTHVRRKAFETFSSTLSKYHNVTATAYQTQVQKEKTLSQFRHFPSVFDYLLFDQKVSMEMYNRQIDLITQKLAPAMRKYARLLKEAHHLDKMTFADLKISIDPSYDPRVTIEESKDIIAKGLSVMGEEYVGMIEQAYKERWIDFAQNIGKSTGGFCASPYGVNNSYILLTWQNRMADIFTLAHELGHAGHFKSCNNAQSLFDTNVSGYFVEAPSTMNELLLGHYLLKSNDDARFKRWVYSSMVSKTYYHNFVTHLLEAAYQREVYRLIDQGQSVSADTLDSLKRKVLSDFWGDEVEINPGAELTWMRQPHYYMGLYSYTYSAGLTVATMAAKRIEEEGETAVEDWKAVLKAGSTLDPVGLAALAHVDITDDKALLETIEIISSYVDKIEELTKVIEEEA